MATLEELARKKFPDLSEAEQRVVQAVPDGALADCRYIGGGDDPANVDAWPPSRNVRAELIRWLCVDRDARKQVDPRGVRIGGARITEPLDLSFTKVLFPLALASCRLEQDLDLKWTKMPLVSLQGSWTGAVHADGLKLEGSLFLSYGFHSDGEVRLGGATIGGDLSATGGTFRNSNGNALFADRINVTGGIYLRNGFSAEGTVRLLGATIAGNLDATGGTFQNLKSDKNPNSTGDALSADGIKVTGDLFLRNGFSAEGAVRLLNATIGGVLDPGGGTFKNPNANALFADGINVKGDVSLRSRFSAEGTVGLVGAEVNGQLSVIDAWLDELILESAHVAGAFFWQNIHKDRHPRFPGKEWKPSLNLTNAKVGALADDERSWPEKGGLILDGFVYDRIYGGPTDAKTRLDWLHLQPDWLGLRPQPYEQLIAVLRQMGHEHQVAKVAIAKQQDLYERGDLGGWGKFWKALKRVHRLTQVRSVRARFVTLARSFDETVNDIVAEKTATIASIEQTSA